MRFSSYLAGPLASFVLLACGDPPVATSGGSSSIAGDGDDPGGGECEPGDEQECECEDGSESLQYCFDDREWGFCNCSEDDEEEDDGAFTGECKPGRYEGNFFGYYYSQFTAGFAAIPVWALSLDGKPGLAFTLNAKGEECALGTEFCNELEISDGYVKGTADGLFPFEGTLTGKLNCKTKKFEAILSGGYAVLVKAVVNEAKFEGPVFGKYDAKTKSFPCQVGAKNFPKCDGSQEVEATLVVAERLANAPFPKPDFPSNWQLTELDPILPPIAGFPYGGGGYWSAEWVGDGSVDTSTGKPSP